MARSSDTVATWCGLTGSVACRPKQHKCGVLVWSLSRALGSTRGIRPGLPKLSQKSQEDVDGRADLAEYK